VAGGRAVAGQAEQFAGGLVAERGRLRLGLAPGQRLDNQLQRARWRGLAAQDRLEVGGTGVGRGPPLGVALPDPAALFGLAGGLGGLVFGGLLVPGRCAAGCAVHVGVAVLPGVGAQVAADLPAGHEPGFACFLVGVELDVGQVAVGGEVVRG
jgi:hypothetical protein